MTQVCLVNVGANTSHRGLRSPLFSNQEFEFVPIPDQLMDYYDSAFAVRYRDLKPRNGRPLKEFINETYYERCVHYDPEFETGTYGDYPTLSPRAANLQRLTIGDFIFFFARLIRWEDGHFKSEAGFYLIGALEIAGIYRNLTQKPTEHAFRRIRNNAHIIRGESNDALYDGFWVFKGRNRLRRFKYAVPLDRRFVERCELTDRNWQTWKWHKFASNLSTIGSYLRSTKIIDDSCQLAAFWGELSKQRGMPGFLRKLEEEADSEQ